ncbi:PspC domain-containing protein [Nocardioides panacisoli]|uniref:PspC domain-containing protein n=1 Tax=Nocardioides panacisoli TaxID=627624 RepID=UPI001C62F7D3|nr:PspC domain-containing protein [Nocardioides panacisoli]QYJ03479.1 PspC domain-containing protein [Nocardioides panacisoli]
MSNYENYSPPPAPRPEGKKLVRTPDDKMIAGVCGGVARYLGLDANLVRILLVVAVIFGFGTGIILYVVGWLLMPEGR